LPAVGCTKTASETMTPPPIGTSTVRPGVAALATDVRCCCRRPWVRDRSVRRKRLRWRQEHIRRRGPTPVVGDRSAVRPAASSSSCSPRSTRRPPAPGPQTRPRRSVRRMCTASASEPHGRPRGHRGVHNGRRMMPARCDEEYLHGVFIFRPPRTIDRRAR
jgi:hypothetical protein